MAKRHNDKDLHEPNDFDELNTILNKMLKEVTGELMKGEQKDGKPPIVLNFNLEIGNLGYGRQPKRLQENQAQQGEPLQPNSEPIFEVSNSDNEVTIIAEMQNFSKDEIKVSGRSRNISIDATGRTGTYHREITIDFNVKPKDIKTNYNNGILEIRVQKGLVGKKN
ncbi:Hsp20/alpha crystallin family protein [Candidatus Marsarchaeota archaeon]|jgi:HSP20 family molecular chaperone IbpA|nr:Hsp20/alpha crystallin family protein [Candidatus Marsarchaeota archaeon]MCL5092077.1 Hsp20/alpha crystallin family protein [Candidatus Marsarchaeota archaeon]